MAAGGETECSLSPGPRPTDAHAAKLGNHRGRARGSAFAQPQEPPAPATRKTARSPESDARARLEAPVRLPRRELRGPHQQQPLIDFLEPLKPSSWRRPVYHLYHHYGSYDSLLLLFLLLLCEAAVGSRAAGSTDSGVAEPRQPILGGEDLAAPSTGG